MVTQGGLLANPYGLAFDEQGNAVIANYGGWNILKVAMDGTTSVFSDGLEYRPIWITADTHGGFYYSSARYYNSSQSTPSGINHLTQDGLIERLRGGDYIRGTAVLNGQLYVTSYYANKLYKVNETALDTSLLANYKTEVTRASNYFLARYQDNSNDNIIHSMRLMGLAEARKVISDQALQSQIDTAIAYIEQLLRSRQRSDGGWGRYTYNGSDAMVTALVGLALDYTNPSADDPLIRKTIQYLLNTQQSNHSWISNNRILSTRLAATSLVVAYLPVALDRLGGIDVDLHLSTSETINLNQPSIEPTSQILGTNNQTDYLWQLLGVTSNSRELTFNLDLLNMVLAEERPVASEAYIQFKNSFTNEQLRIDLTIPTVKALSELRLQLSTDKTAYQANEPVVIDLGVNNTGPTTAEGRIELQIRAVGSIDALDTLPSISASGILEGQLISLTSDWNTGITLAGEYEVYAQLFDAQNRLLDQQVTPFSIVHGDSPVVDGRVVTDKPFYQAWDQVIIDGRVENVSANVIQPEIRYELTITDPLGTVILSENGQLNELVAGGLQDREFTLTLIDALDGQYAVTWLIQDAFSRDLLATKSTSFRVERHSLQGVRGQVAVNHTQLFKGDPVLCTEQLTNIAASDLTGLAVTHQLIQVETSQVIDTQLRSVTLTDGQVSIDVQNITTEQLAIGEYACFLSAEIEGQTKQLGAAIFNVIEPPIKIEGHLGAGDRGRVLVLIDDAPKQCDGFNHISVEATMTAPLVTGTTVTGILYDQTGANLDQETGVLDDRLLDLGAGTEGVNLIVDDIALTHVAMTFESQTVLNQGYRVVISAVNGDVTENFDSGVMATDCSNILETGDLFGDLRLTNVVRLPAANDPLGPNHTPDLGTQRTVLESVLTAAGWSYTITTNEEDFTQQMHSGGYVAYLLLSEQIKLNETVQKELREAVYRGEGLIEAGGHDQRQGRIDEALGIKSQGKHASMQGLVMTDNAWANLAQTDFQLNDRTLKATLQGASELGVFVSQGQSTTESAITHFAYGQGQSLYFGFDLAAEIALQNADQKFETMLLDALNTVHPVVSKAQAKTVYPLRLTVQNLGVATPGQAIMTLPDNLSVIDAGIAAINGQTLIWPFTLAESEPLWFDLWLTLPEQPVQLNALIQSGSEPNWTDQATFSFEVTPEPQVNVDDVYQQTLLLTDKAYKQTQKYVQWAQTDSQAGRWEDTLSSLIRAADTLTSLNTAESSALRSKIAQAIRTVSMHLTPSQI